MQFVSDGQIITSKISAIEKFQFGISLGLAKYYSAAISDNVKRAIEQKLRKGEWPEERHLDIKHYPNDIVIDEFNAMIIKRLFELHATGTYSMQLLRKNLLKNSLLRGLADLLTLS